MEGPCRILEFRSISLDDLEVLTRAGLHFAGSYTQHGLIVLHTDKSLLAGSWKKLQVDGALADVDWLQRDAGEVAIQLRASPTSIEGVHNVEVGSCILHMTSVSAQEMPADKPPLLAMEPASQGAYCDS